nr:MAG TPA: hypothetical protein [Bacteriophage sp.]
MPFTVFFVSYYTVIYTAVTCSSAYNSAKKFPQSLCNLSIAKRPILAYTIIKQTKNTP